MAAVLQARDVGLLAGLTENTVKQWTIGRPYAIRPSVRLSSGKGVPNLYSLTDALLFAVARDLTADGFQSWVIQKVLNSFEPAARTVLITKDDIEFSQLSMSRCAARQERETRDLAQRSFYVLDMQTLREFLNENWRQLLSKGLLHGANPLPPKQPAPKKAGR